MRYVAYSGDTKLYRVFLQKGKIRNPLTWTYTKLPLAIFSRAHSNYFKYLLQKNAKRLNPALFPLSFPILMMSPITEYEILIYLQLATRFSTGNELYSNGDQNDVISL